MAQAEGSVSGNRVRQFTANELVALARVFDLPVIYFFLPPEDRAGEFRTADAVGRGWPWEYLLLLVWGHSGNFPLVAERAAPWVHVSTVLVPEEDVLEPLPENPVVAKEALHRDRLTPEDMLAVAFNGLARRRMRGSQILGQDVKTLAQNLRSLADLLEAFDGHKPGAPFDADELRRINRQRRMEASGED